jgi:3-hydroxybutyryl-CoA dehydrogenase
MGPFETLDMVGLEITYKAMSTIYEETGDEKFRPTELFKRKVEAGHLGRKTGKGWYVYDECGKPIGPAED